jgi:exodeoxyribonuclease VII large subunit
LHLAQAVDRQLLRRGERLERLAGRSALADPGRPLERRAARLAALELRLEAAPQQRLARLAQRLEAAGRRLEPQSPRRRLWRLSERLAALGPALGFAGRSSLERPGQRLATAAARLEAISPLAVLARGYALAQRADGSGVRASSQLEVGELLELRFGSGRAAARVEALDPPRP